MKRSLLTALLALTCSAALFAQYTQTGLYEDNNRRPVPGTGTVELALAALDRALFANPGNGYGNYTIRVKEGDAVPPIFFVDGDSNYAANEFGNLKAANLKHGLKIAGIPDATGKLPTIQLNDQGRMFDMADNANVKMSIENITLLGWASSGTIERAAAITQVALMTIPENPRNTDHDDNTVSLVYVGSGNEFVMNSGGTITGNATPDMGGGVQVQGGTVTMNAGSAIVYNSASMDGIYGGGGGVYISNGGKFVMNGGTISGNSVLYSEGLGEWAGGVMVGSEGLIPYQYGGERSTFDMYGGAITGNYCGSDGGGVVVFGAIFTMSGANALISGNYANNLCGGVGAFSLDDDDEDVFGDFIMAAGELSNNNSGDPTGSQFDGSGGRLTWPEGTHGIVYVNGLSGGITHEAYGPCGISIGDDAQIPATVIRAVQ
jgi:hypothetical protein